MYCVFRPCVWDLFGGALTPLSCLFVPLQDLYHILSSPPASHVGEQVLTAVLLFLFLNTIRGSAIITINAVIYCRSAVIALRSSYHSLRLHVS